MSWADQVHQHWRARWKDTKEQIFPLGQIEVNTVNVPTTQSLIWFCTTRRATTGSMRFKIGSHGAMFGQMGHSGTLRAKGSSLYGPPTVASLAIISWARLFIALASWADNCGCWAPPDIDSQSALGVHVMREGFSMSIPCCCWPNFKQILETETVGLDGLGNWSERSDDGWFVGRQGQMVSDGGGQEPRAHLGRSGQVPEAPTYGSATLHHAYKPPHIGDEKLPVELFLSIHTVQHVVDHSALQKCN